MSGKYVRFKAVAEFIESCDRENALADLKETLLSLLEMTTIHEKKLAVKLQGEILKLRGFRTIDKGGLSEKEKNMWTNSLYYYFYFAVTDKLHSDMAFSLYPELEADLQEYNSKITLMYGVTGTPGMYQLYAMANRKNPNILALYECGELEYYGKGPSGKVNYNNAYNYYMRTKECNNEHPLACWSIAYMRFHYSQERARLMPEYRVDEFERELINGKGTRWFDEIMYDVQSSYDNGCSAAANLLGKIVESSDEVFPINRRGRFKTKKAKDLFQESAEAGYVYGCNSYAQACLKEAEVVASKREKEQLLKDAVFYMEKSATIGSPWASNKMGNYYYYGLTLDGNTIIEQDIELAYERYLYAQIMGATEEYYWPLINLCKLFWLNDSSTHYMEKDINWIRAEVVRALEKAQDDEQRSQLKRLQIAASAY